ncbi:MAG: hypothetical protein WKG06_08290 [Segetibacter sp.]
MKKLKIFSIIAFALSLTGCLKDDPNVDFSNVAPTAEISSGSLVSDNSPISGLSYFKSATLPSFSKDTSCDCYLPDTVTFNVNITGEFPPTKDVTVTLGIDDTKRVAYNSLPTSDVQYSGRSRFYLYVGYKKCISKSRIKTGKSFNYILS